MKKPPTIREVAAAAGVSRASAQRALAGNPHCSPSVRAKVHDAAEELGYCPDPVFASMGSRRAKSASHGLPIAYVDRSDAPGGHYAEHARARASELGYELRVVDCDSCGGDRFYDVLYAQGFVGILTGRLKDSWYDILARNQIFPVVCCGRARDLPFHVVRGAIVAGIIDAWRHVMAHGYGRIGAAIFRHSPPIDDDLAREAAVLLCQKEFVGKGEPVPLLLAGHNDRESLISWFEQHRPDAVIGFGPLHYFQLKHHGVRIPEDVAFAALHLHGDNDFKAGIAGLDPLFGQVGIAAVNLLDQMIRHGERGVPEVPMTVSFEPRWIPGKTMPPKAEWDAPRKTAKAEISRRQTARRK